MFGLSSSQCFSFNLAIIKGVFWCAHGNLIPLTDADRSPQGPTLSPSAGQGEASCNYNT